MNAVTTFEAETLSDEIASVTLADGAVAANAARQPLQAWFNNLPLDRKFKLLAGVPLAALTFVTAGFFWVLSASEVAGAGPVMAAIGALWAFTVVVIGLALRRGVIDTAGPLHELTTDMISLAT